MSPISNKKKNILLLVDCPPTVKNPIRPLKTIYEKKYPEYNISFWILPGWTNSIMQPHRSTILNFIEYALIFFKIFINKHKMFIAQNIAAAISQTEPKKIIIVRVLTPSDRVRLFAGGTYIHRIVNDYCYGTLENHPFTREFIHTKDFPDYFSFTNNKQKNKIMFVDFEKYLNNPHQIFGQIGLKDIIFENINFYPIYRPKYFTEEYAKTLEEDGIQEQFTFEYIK